MKSEDSVHFSVRVDRTLTWHLGESVRYIGLQLDVPKDRPSLDRPAHHLALALDVSRHLGSAGMRHARSIAWRLADKLNENDTLSVVTLGERPHTLVDRVAMDGNGRTQVREMLRQLEPTNKCNLFDGWIAAATNCARAMTDSEAHHRVVLVTTGQSDFTCPSPVELSGYARNLELRSLPTTVVGIGSIMDPARLVAIDDGTIRFSEMSSEEEHISDALLFGCLELSPPIAFELECECWGPPGTQSEPFESLGNYGSRPIPKLARELRAGARRREIFRVTLPPGRPGTTLEFEARASFMTAGTASRKHTKTAKAEFTFATGAQNTPQPRDLVLSHQVAMRWQAAMLREAIDLMAHGAAREVDRFVAQQLRYLERYCSGLPSEDLLLGMIQRGLRTLRG
jgi:hypothetical protein